MTDNIRVRSLYQIPGKDLYCIAFKYYDDNGYPAEEGVEFHMSSQELWDAVTEYRDNFRRITDSTIVEAVDV